MQSLRKIVIAVFAGPKNAGFVSKPEKPPLWHFFIRLIMQEEKVFEFLFLSCFDRKKLGAAPLVLSSAQLNEKFLSDALASLGADASLRSGLIPLIERHCCLHMLKVLRSAHAHRFFEGNHVICIIH